MLASVRHTSKQHPSRRPLRRRVGPESSSPTLRIPTEIEGKSNPRSPGTRQGCPRAREETAGLQRRHRRSASGSRPTPHPTRERSRRQRRHVPHAEQPARGLRPRPTEPGPQGPLPTAKRERHPPLRAGAPAGQVLATLQKTFSRQHGLCDIKNETEALGAVSGICGRAVLLRHSVSFRIFLALSAPKTSKFVG